MRISDWSSDVCSSDLHFSSGQRNDRECKEADKVVGISHCTFRTEGQPREKQRRSKDPRQCEIPWKIDTTPPHVETRIAWPSIELVHPLTALPLASIAQQQQTDPRPHIPGPPPHHTKTP